MKSAIRMITAAAMFIAFAGDAAESFLGNKAKVTTLHPTTNYFVISMGDGTNAAIRLINSSNTLELLKTLTGYSAASQSDLASASNVLRSAFVANDTTTSNALRTLFYGADVTTSNGIVTLLYAADITTSNGMATLFYAADTTTSNGVVTLVQTRQGGSATLTNLTTLYFTGTGSPEGSVAARVGAIYACTNSCTGWGVYVKTNGTGNTGWYAMQDTVGAGGSLTDGDKGDVTVASSGTAWTLNAGVVTPAKASGGIITNNYASDWSSIGNIRAPNLVYSNIVVVDATNASASINGLRFSNACMTATAGTRIQVGPGRYYIPTNNVSLLRNGVQIYCEPGAIITSGTAADVDPHYMFDDTSGQINASIVGYGQFYMTNGGGESALAYFTNAASSVIMYYDTAWAVGQFPCLEAYCGSFWFHGRYTRSDGYDAFLGGGTTSKVYGSGDYIGGGDSIIEPGECANWGDMVFNFKYGEAHTGGTGANVLNVPDNVLVHFDVIRFLRSGSIYGSEIRNSPTGSGILDGAVIYALPNSTVPVVYRGQTNFSTSFTMRNCVIYGPTNRYAIDLTTHTGGPRTNYFTLDNCAIYAGFNATNAIYSTNAQNVAVKGTLFHSKPFGATITLTQSQTNALVNTTLYGPARAYGVLSAYGGIDVTTPNDITSSGGGNLLISGGGGINVSGGSVVADHISPALATLSRVAMIGPDGYETNVAAGAAGEFLKYDGTSATPASQIFSPTLSNATIKPLVVGTGNAAGATNSTGQIRGLEAGANVTITPNGSNLVIAASGGAAATNFNTASFNTLEASNLVQVGQVDVKTNLNAQAVTATNSVTAALVNAGQVDVRTNLNAKSITSTNSVTSPLITAGQLDIRTNLNFATATGTNSLTVPLVTSGQADVRTNARLGSLTVTNYQERLVTNSTATTASIDFNGPSLFRYAPAGTFTLSFVNTPSAGTPARSVDMELLTQQTGTFPSGIDWGSDGAAIVVTGITNRYRFYWNGTNVVGLNGQWLTTGTGTFVLQTNGILSTPFLTGATATNGILHQTTNGNPVLLKAAVSNSFAVTNIVGVIEKNATNVSVLELNANDSNEFIGTNRISLAMSVIFTNTAPGQTISATFIGEASGGTSRTLTLIPHLGTLVADGDTYGTALATSSSLTLTNGNAVEINWKIVKMRGTNIAVKVSRQFAF